MQRRIATIVGFMLTAVVALGCGGGGSDDPVAQDSAPVEVAPKERPESTVGAARLSDLRPGYLPAGVEERPAAGGTGETGLLPPVSVGGPTETSSAPVTTVDVAGSRFAHTWSATPASPADLVRVAMISVVGYPESTATGDVAAGGGGEWVDAGARRVYLAERPEPDVTSLTASWVELDVVVSAKARNVERAEFLKVIAALQPA
jgi:hypothetical protein